MPVEVIILEISFFLEAYSYPLTKADIASNPNFHSF
jgi:hypothetical protein